MTRTSRSSPRASVCSRSSTPARRLGGRPPWSARADRRPRRSGRTPRRDVIRSQSGNRARIYTLRPARRASPAAPSCLELVATFGRRRNEEIADLLEPLGAELVEEGDRLLRETHLAAVENCWRTPPIALPVDPDAISSVREHDVSRAEQREVVRDASSYGAATGDDDSSHCSSSFCSASVSVRNGRRTSGPAGLHVVPPRTSPQPGTGTARAPHAQGRGRHHL